MGIMSTPETIEAHGSYGNFSPNGKVFDGSKAAQKNKAEAAKKARYNKIAAAQNEAAAAGRMKERAANRATAGEQQIQEMHGLGSHETTGEYVSWMKDSEKKAAKDKAAKMKARTVKSNATRAENAAKGRVQALGYNDTHRDQLGRGSYVGLENFLKNEASNKARAEWRKKNRPTTVKPGKSPKAATSANMIPAPKAVPAKNQNLSNQQL